MATCEIEVDARGRASLKSAGVAQGRYRVSAIGSSIKLEPVLSYTRAEILALSDPEVRAAHDRFREDPESFTPADDLP